MRGLNLILGTRPRPGTRTRPRPGPLLRGISEDVEGDKEGGEIASGTKGDLGRRRSSSLFVPDRSPRAFPSGMAVSHACSHARTETPKAAPASGHLLRRAECTRRSGVASTVPSEHRTRHLFRAEWNHGMTRIGLLFSRIDSKSVLTNTPLKQRRRLLHGAFVPGSVHRETT